MSVMLLPTLAFVLFGCERTPTTAPVAALAPQKLPASMTDPEWFADVTERLGVQFVHKNGEKGDVQLPKEFGSGAALFDYDNDGRLDIYLIQGGGTNDPARNQLYHQEPDGHFKDVSTGSGLDIIGRGTGVAVGDIHNDGLTDLFVCEYGGVHLFRNNGGGIFTDITEEAGIQNSGWATTGAFFDYDRDGWLDLVIVNFIQYDESIRCFDGSGKPEFCVPRTFPGTVTKLYHNLGRAPGSQAARFEDVTTKSGLVKAPSDGLGIVCADFDGDGWSDIFISDDGHPNRLFINQRDGTFKDEAVVRGMAYDNTGMTQANMGIAFGDVDGDGLADIYITHMTEERNILWKQGPPGLFQDVTGAAGLASPEGHGTGFGDAFADFNNDGTLDLAVVNGRVRRSLLQDFTVQFLPELGPFWSAYAEANQLFTNDGTGKFRDISKANPAFCKPLRIGRGLAVGDIDNDGGLDLLVTNVLGPAKVYRNVCPNRGHWLQVRAIEPVLGGRDAHCAKVTVTAGGRRRAAWINSSYSYLCSNDPRAHFGLGALSAVDGIEVEWPDGSQEHFPATSADKLIVLRHGEGSSAPHAATH